MIRANLAGWNEHLVPLLAEWTHIPGATRAYLNPVVAFSPDGKLIATGATDQTVRLWDGRDGKPIGEAIDCRSELRGLVFSPDGQTLAIPCRDGKPRFWDMIRGSFIAGKLDGLERVFSIAYSHDGKFLAAGGDDGALRFWDIASGRLLSAVDVHHGVIVKVFLARDDQTIITVSENGNLDQWNVKDGVRLAHALGERVRVGRSKFRWTLSGDRWLPTANPGSGMRAA